MPRKFKFYDRQNRPKLEYPPAMSEYIDYEVIDKVKKTGDSEDDFEIYQEVREVKTNIKEFINSFSKDVGVENILRKVATTKDISLLNEKEAIYMDTTIIPDDPEEAFKLANSVDEAYSKIDPELTNGLNMEDFIKGLTQEKLESYIDKKVEEQLAKKGAQDNESSK